MENNRLERVTEKYLLALIKHGDKEDPLFKAFLGSLPKETKVELEGSLWYQVGGHGRDYFLLAGPDFLGLDKRYFRQMNGSAAFPIEDLSIRECFRQRTDINYDKEMTENIDGKVGKMLDAYKRLSNTSPEALLTQQLVYLIDKSVKEESLPENLQAAKIQKEQFFKEKGFWRKETELAAPTRITLTLNYVNMTLDWKDLGTYKGALNNLKRVD